MIEEQEDGWSDPRQCDDCERRLPQRYAGEIRDEKGRVLAHVWQCEECGNHSFDARDQ